MNDQTPGVLPSDQNVLFAVLALESKFIDRDSMVDAMGIWAREGKKPLGQILFEQGKVSVERRLMIDALVDERLASDTGNGITCDGLPTSKLPFGPIGLVSGEFSAGAIARCSTTTRDGHVNARVSPDS